MFALLVLCALTAFVRSNAAMPIPFTRQLELTSPLMSGSDVTIAQNLLIRDDAVESTLECDGYFGSLSESATKSFQVAHQLEESGVLDSTTASLLLDLHSNDNYKDSGFTAASMGYLYKLYFPVYYNRSIGEYGCITYIPVIPLVTFALLFRSIYVHLDVFVLMQRLPELSMMPTTTLL